LSNFILPDAIKLTCKTIPQEQPEIAQELRKYLDPQDILHVVEKVEFVYEETFTKLQVPSGTTIEQFIENSLSPYKEFGESIGIKFESIENGIRLSGTVSREKFGNMMITEFLHWGTIGKISLSDMLMGATIGFTEASKDKNNV
jgi:hypothetical protein